MGLPVANAGQDERRPPSISSLQAGFINSALPRGDMGLGIDLSKPGAYELTRFHPIIQERADALRINILALNGGRPYIEERLSRFAGEHAISWEGGTRKDGSTVTGRKEQAHCIPYPGRIAEKINQYVFAEDVKRDGADPDFIKNVSRGGESIRSFFRRLNSYITATGWAWILVDMPKIENPANVSVLDKEKQKLRPYWVLYSPESVVDWHFDEVGNLKWVLVEVDFYDGSNPSAAPVCRRQRELWQPGKKTVYWYDEVAKTIKTESVEFTNKTIMPWVLVGVPAATPHLFDSIESINRSILDLESCSRQNYFDRCFPQMHVPASVINAMQNVLKDYTTEQMMEMLIGLNYPILTEEGDTPPGYIMPAGLDQVDTKIDKLKHDMFECVGLMLKQESRDAMSGDAKAWDHLDVEQVLKDRAALLQEGETAAVAKSKEWDPEFKEYEPVYPSTFTVADFAADLASLLSTGQIQMPKEMNREILLKVFDVVQRLGVSKIPPERIKEVEAAIEAFVAEQDDALEEAAGTRFGEGPAKEEPDPDAEDEEADDEEDFPPK